PSSSRPGTCSGSSGSVAWSAWPSGDAGRLPSGEGQLAALGVDPDGVALSQVAGEQAPGQLVADGLGDQPPQRPGPVGRIVAAVGQPGLGGRGPVGGGAGGG